MKGLGDASSVHEKRLTFRAFLCKIGVRRCAWSVVLVFGNEPHF